MYQLKTNDFFLRSQSAFCIEARAPQENFPEHSHDFEEIIIVSSGCGTHVLNDIPSSLLQNSVFFVKQNDRHLFENVDNLYLTNILFKRENLKFCQKLREFLPTQTTHMQNWFINKQSLTIIESLISLLKRETINQLPGSKLMEQALFQQLIIELWRGKVTTSNQLMNDTDKTFHVLQWLNEHYAEIFTMDSLAEQFQISPRALAKGIKQVSKQSLTQNIHRIRVNKAKQLMLYTDSPITDIAFQVGYSDSNYFSTKFKQVTQQSPSEFRELALLATR